MCIRIYIFDFLKKRKNARRQSLKETKEEKSCGKSNMIPWYHLWISPGCSFEVNVDHVQWEKLQLHYNNLHCTICYTVQSVTLQQQRKCTLSRTKRKENH